MGKRRDKHHRSGELQVPVSQAEAEFTDLDLVERPDLCWECGEQIHVMAFRGTRLCSVKCKKAWMSRPIVESMKHSRALFGALS